MVISNSGTSSGSQENDGFLEIYVDGKNKESPWRHCSGVGNVINHQVMGLSPALTMSVGTQRWLVRFNLAWGFSR